jgi:tRNA pseudouridine32 synthase/23S rRNA pseudouridine746 synthase
MTNQYKDNCYFHPLPTIYDNKSIPDHFTYPFCYQPHPISLLAAKDLQQHLVEQNRWSHNFGLDKTHTPVEFGLGDGIGKMFGVLVVIDDQQQLGYLAAFSGKVAESNHLPGFVPPVFDMLAQESFFVTESNQINQLNQCIEEKTNNPIIAVLENQLADIHRAAQEEIALKQANIALNRQQRKQQRKDAQSTLDNVATSHYFEQLAKASVLEKNQLKHLKQNWLTQVKQTEQQLNDLVNEIHDLKDRRKNLSAALQEKLFAQYRFLNAEGVNKSLTELFTIDPPAGTGECAAPKLLQFAYLHGYKPIALAEFWWGCSPKSELRKHQHYYPACQNKCLPLLTHMMQGLTIEDNPLLHNFTDNKDIEIIFADDAIVVINKPEEFLSVPGIHIEDSAFSRLKARYHHLDEGPFVVHRLDMSTSGLLVFALTRRANRDLQKQFINRTVEKRYLAVVEGTVIESTGTISLPLRGDLNDRPRQLVCQQNGKPAHTDWQVIEQNETTTRLYLFPKTGRTHQLRVHCAHPSGLNMPIVGDDLYGQRDSRLHLHAESLTFNHPYTKERLVFTVAPNF